MDYKPAAPEPELTIHLFLILKAWRSARIRSSLLCSALNYSLGFSLFHATAGSPPQCFLGSLFKTHHHPSNCPVARGQKERGQAGRMRMHKILATFSAGYSRDFFRNAPWDGRLDMETMVCGVGYLRSHIIMLSYYFDACLSLLVFLLSLVHLYQKTPSPPALLA